MNDLDALRAELRRYTYKPGWKLSIESSPAIGIGTFPMYSLAVSFAAEDTYNRGATVRVSGRYPIPPDIGAYPGGFGKWLQFILIDVERHESREWLRCDSEIFDDPHALPVPPAASASPPAQAVCRKGLLRAVQALALTAVAVHLIFFALPAFIRFAGSP